jgi:hypothetical protein
MSVGCHTKGAFLKKGAACALWRTDSKQVPAYDELS